MKKLFFVPALMGLLLFSCTKKDARDISSNTPSSPVTEGISIPKVKTFTTPIGGTTNYMYNPNGTIFTIIQANNVGEKFGYTGSPTTVVVNKYSSSGSLMSRRYIKLDPDFLAVYMTFEGLPNWETRYEFDANRQKTREYIVWNGAITMDDRFFYSATGAMDSMHHYQYGQHVRREVYLNDETQVNTIGSENFGELFFGVQPQGLRMEAFVESLTNGGHSFKRSYKYVMDNESRVVTRWIDGQANSFTYY